jgi:O-antigen/teichoic acid export membrane protein
MLMGVRLWVALIGLGAAFSAIVLPTVFGPSFAESSQPLMILLVGASFLAAYLAVVSALIAADESPLIARVSIVCVAINLAVDIALIPTVGLIGPAVATTVQSAAGAIWLLSRTLGTKRLLEIVRANAPVAVAVSALAVDTGSPVLLAITAIASLYTAAPALRWLREGGLQLRGAQVDSPLQP